MSMAGCAAVLGLDIGSSGAKARILRPDGSQAAAGWANYQIHRDEAGGVEIDPTEMLSAVGQMIEQTIARSGSTVSAIAIGAIGEAIVPVDANYRPLANAMLTADRRMAGSVRFWLEQSDELTILDKTGLPPRDMWSVNAMRFHARQSDVVSRLFRFCTLEDLVVAALGVTPRMSISQAARTMIFDRRSKNWADDLVRMSGIPRSALPNVAVPGERLGEMPRTVFGLAAGTIVVSGGHDQFLAALGAGADGRQALWSSGTVESIALISGESRPRVGVPTYQVHRNVWVSPVPNLNGGVALAWLCKLLSITDPEKVLSSTADDEDDTIIVPTLGPTGGPDFSATAIGAIVGLQYGSDAASLVRAMVRGIVHESFHAATLFGASTLDRIEGFALAGGGSRSAYWNRWRAAAFGKPVSTRMNHDCGCIGAALLAQEALAGALPDLGKFNPPLAQIEPRGKDIARFGEEHERYLDLRAKLLAAEPAEEMA